MVIDNLLLQPVLLYKLNELNIMQWKFQIILI